MTYYFRGKYHQLSNFFPAGFQKDGKRWPTAEHYFQAMKFKGVDEDYVERIRLAKTPELAKQMGRTRKIPIRWNWRVIKEKVMYEALKLKFANPAMKEALLRTKKQGLIENSPDEYWGIGKSGQGQNRLGILLMRLRKELKKK